MINVVSSSSSSSFSSILIYHAIPLSLYKGMRSTPSTGAGWDRSLNLVSALTLMFITVLTLALERAHERALLALI